MPLSGGCPLKNSGYCQALEAASQKGITDVLLEGSAVIRALCSFRGCLCDTLL